MSDQNNPKSEAALREEKILDFWHKNKIFEKSLKQTEGKKEFVFYDGPVTANSKPVLHTMVPFSFKDAIPRYRTMRGYHVRRKGGWDTHGLPVELQIEKKLGFKSKNDIENYGIAAFNKLCRDSVWEFVELWKSFTARMGYWADQENAYVTYHNSYIESLWNIVKKVHERNLIFKDYKVVPWCPRCGTALSSHELAQGYEDVKDLSVYVKFQITSPDAFTQSLGPSLRSATPSQKHAGSVPKFFLAWTTTPWTLPGNVALAVGKDIDYVEIKVGKEILVLAKERLSIITDPYEIIAEHKGSEMVGMQYEPLFPFLEKTIPQNEKAKLEKAFKIYAADFVNTQDGTGIVHTAVMYGQDDFELGSQVGLPKHHLVNLEGEFIKGTGFLESRFVREVDDKGKPTLAVDIIEDLKKRNVFFKQENYKHSYPHCWRCKTALIYYARDSWYVRMSDPAIKAELVKENKNINWEPAHIREGRFGEWLGGIKDWAISRERYWGTPLPLWQCASCSKIHAIGSIHELKERTKKSGNKYFVMRHGEAENNAQNIYSSDPNKNHLTQKGKMQVLRTAESLKGRKITKIISSPFLRTKETAELLADEIGFDKKQIIFDDRIRELEFGDFSERPVQDYWDFMGDKIREFDTPVPTGESFQDGKRRFGDFLYDVDSKYTNETILIVSHGLAVEIIPGVIEGADKARSAEILAGKRDNRNAELHREHEFVRLPHNADYELDLHKPFIDELELVCACGGNLSRTKEVMDVWFDSGAMPFAQDHYPFQNKEWVEGPGYPADFISEAIDQTRGWFYTLHAIGVLMRRGKAFKNVICLGHLLDAKGKKMSKSLGNIVDPWMMMDKYGVDTLRLWMYSVNQPGESKNFDEKTVILLHQQVFTLLYNVLAFYELYRDRNLERSQKPASQNILDKWILAKLDQLINLATNSMDDYKLLEPTRAIRDFISDLSTWYLRRSRDRIKNGEKDAKQTLYYTLFTLAKVMAPFAPFAAEDLWLRLRSEGDKESVHLETWPKMSKGIFEMFNGRKQEKITSDMARVRETASAILRERQKANIPVRQILASASGPAFSDEHVDIIKEEVNVKEYKGIDTVGLDTTLTPELKQEGNYREFIRALQDIRKKMNLTPSDVVELSLDTGEEGKKLIQAFAEDIKKTVLVSNIHFGASAGESVTIDNLVFTVEIKK